MHLLLCTLVQCLINVSNISNIAMQNNTLSCAQYLQCVATAKLVLSNVIVYYRILVSMFSCLFYSLNDDHYLEGVPRAQTHH